MPETNAETLRKAREFVANTGNNDLAERLDGRLADKQDAIQTVVELKNLVKQSEANGLDDDPAVEALREEAEALAEEHGLVDTSPSEALTEEYGLDEGVVDRLHEEDRERLLANLQAVEEIETNRSERSGTSLADHEIDVRRSNVEQLLDHNQVQAAALAGGVDDAGADTVAAFLDSLGEEEDHG